MHGCGNWERGLAVSFLGVHTSKSDLVCSVSHLKGSNHEIFVANVFKKFKPVLMDHLGTVLNMRFKNIKRFSSSNIKL
jgi:hypothetical protein